MEDEKRSKGGLDRISNLPLSIIETILCRLPTKDAVRTSILSTEWKYHWTKIPKFKFIQNRRPKFWLKKHQQGEETTPVAKRKQQLFSVINQVMSMHQCPIHEFFLSTPVGGACVEVDHIIDDFSRNNDLKKLKLDTCGYRLPESFFSLHKLTDLYLKCCRLLDGVQLQPNGFGSLTYLHMNGLMTTKRMLQLFLSGCPLLKTVVLIPSFVPDNDDDSTLAQLFECLPAEIEYLTVQISIMKYYDQGRVPQLLPATALVHLKHLRILDSKYRYRFHSLVYLLRSCPNIEKLTLKISHHLLMPRDGEDLIRSDSYSDIWLRHLKVVEIFLFKKMTFFDSFQLILAKSPMLEKVKILLSYKASNTEMSMIEGSLSVYPRISTVVKFVIERLV